jgi:hypothetical protein
MNYEKRTSSSRWSPELSRAIEPWSDSDSSGNLCLPATSIVPLISLAVLSGGGEAIGDRIYRSHRVEQSSKFSLSIVTTASSIVSG